MVQVPINYLAVVVCSVIYMAIGYVWYGVLFMKPWMKLMGMTQADVKKSQANMGKTYGINFISALIMFFVLAHFVYFTWTAAMNDSGVTPIMVGLKTGLWAWLGFVATSGMNDFLFNPKAKSWNLYAINQGYLLVSLLIGGAILGVWM
jgi:hypothetical protein